MINKTKLKANRLHYLEAPEKKCFKLVLFNINRKEKVMRWKTFTELICML